MASDWSALELYCPLIGSLGFMFLWVREGKPPSNNQSCEVKCCKHPRVRIEKELRRKNEKFTKYPLLTDKRDLVQIKNINHYDTLVLLSLGLRFRT